MGQCFFSPFVFIANVTWETGGTMYVLEEVVALTVFVGVGLGCYTLHVNASWKLQKRSFPSASVIRGWKT